MEQDFIIGIHSIACALQNPRRTGHRLFASQSTLEELRKKVGKVDIPITKLSSHDLQEEAKKQFNRFQTPYRRIANQMFLLTDKLPAHPPEKLFQEIKDSEKKLRLIALDGVTDHGNAAAIVRTAAFFGANALITSVKGSFGEGPWFFKTASGALEFVKIIRIASLPKFLVKLQKMGVHCLGLNENAPKSSLQIPQDVSLCLILGAEDKGLSHGVSRVLPHQAAITGQGPEQSLNVSVAAAIYMDRLWGEAIDN